MDIRHFFATTAKGIEMVLARELERLGFDDIFVEKGGVRFAGDLAACYRANLWLRTAQRILVSLAEFGCVSPQQLYDGVRSVYWRRYLNPDMTLAVDCNVRDSSITHSGFAALKTKDAIVDSIREHFGRRPNVNAKDPDLRVNVHIARNHCSISLDSSGSSLDKRGYRIDAEDAPIRETLAAALIELTEWDGSVPLMDPMCGSGTIPIEAALKGANLAPGLRRVNYGFQRWPSFDGTVWKNLVKEAENQVFAEIPCPISGFDVSSRAIEKARKNANRAGVGKFLTFMKQDILQIKPPSEQSIIIFNPPYGVRLGEQEPLKILYKGIGDALKRYCTGSTAYVFCGNPELAKWIGLKASRRTLLFNGPIECRLLKYELH
ncbi:MAG TPA: THUMP domain-containing protein [Geobacteraceae bacterium]|nr:THUMP domain-containing protein [Geobacteraceae bacterium]